MLEIFTVVWVLLQYNNEQLLCQTTMHVIDNVSVQYNVYAARQYLLCAQLMDDSLCDRF